MKRDYLRTRLEGCLSPIAKKAGIGIQTSLIDDLWHRVAWDAKKSTHNDEADLLEACSCLLIELERLMAGEWNNWLHFTNNVLPSAAPHQVQSLYTQWWISQQPNKLDKKTRRLLKRNPPSLEACLELQHRINHRVVQKMEFLLELFASSNSLHTISSETSSQINSLLSHVASQERPWSMRIAACRALRSFFAAGRKPDRSIIACLESIVLSKHAHPYVRGAAHAALCETDPQGAVSLAQLLFERPEKSKDAFLTRRALLYIMTQCGHQGRKLLFKAARQDTSPAVRQKAVELLLTSDEQLPDAFFTQITSTEPREVRAAWIPALMQARSDITVFNALELAGLDLPITEELEYKIACLRSLTDWLASVKPERVSPNIIQAFKTLKSRLQQSIHAEGVSIGLHAHWWTVINYLSIRIEPAISLYFNDLQKQLYALADGGRLRLRKNKRLEDRRCMEMIFSALASYDFGCFVKTGRRKWVIQRGARRKPSLWRLLFEIFNPAFDKRQAHSCTNAIRYFGDLWFPSLIMADLTRTRVPGENSYCASFGSWVPHIPGPTQAVNVGMRSHVRMCLPGISVEIHAAANPIQRALGQTRCKIKFKALDDLRFRTLQDGCPQALSDYLLHYQRQCLQSIQAVSEDSTWEKHTEGRLKSSLPMLLPLSWLASVSTNRFDLFQEIWSPSTNTLFDLGVFLAVSGILLFSHRCIKTHKIKKNRRNIPLVVGGWGSRGKSGTERLKQALFHGLGYQTLSKTTGTVATMISSIPGVDPVEIPLFRPFNKATIWEQVNVLQHASELGAQVFLWECMAVNPHFVGVLAGDWMHDSYSTITNTYPDHEDHQGPSGYDVAKSISMFTPNRAHLFTSERQMTPVLQQKSMERRSLFNYPPCAASYLIPKEYLDRFPYLEHPFNIALVQELARHLGIDEDLALIVMADNLLADIGGLKQFGPIEIAGRRTDFSNIMSANEREGFLASIKHLGFDQWQHANRLRENVILIVNNREDRPARSRVFADLIVRDVASSGIIVVGSAIMEFSTLLEQAWSTYLQERHQPSGPQVDAQVRWLQSLYRPFRIDPTQSDNWDQVIGNWLDLNPSDVRSTLQPIYASIAKKTASPQGGWTSNAIESVYLEHKPALLAAINTFESHGHGLAFPGKNELAESCSLELTLSSILSGYHKKCMEAGQGQSIAKECIELARVMFKKQVMVPDRLELSPDNLTEIGTSLAPPASNVHLVGCQNIKGVGLALVRAWQSISTIQEKLTQLESRDGFVQEQALEWLCSQQYYTPITARLINQSFHARCNQDLSRLSPKESALLERLNTLSTSNQPVKKAKVRKTSPLRQLVGKNLSAILDTFDSITRRRQSDKIMQLLSCGLIGHNEASEKLQEILNRQELMVMEYRKSKKPKPR